MDEPTDQLHEQHDPEHQSGYKLSDVCASEMFFRFEWATMPVTLTELTLRSQNTGHCQRAKMSALSNGASRNKADKV